MQIIEARYLIGVAACDPATLEILAEVFDEVWRSNVRLIGGNAEQVASVRRQLATIVLALSRDGQLSPLQICRTASRLLRQIGAKNEALR